MLDSSYLVPTNHKKTSWIGKNQNQFFANYSRFRAAIVILIADSESSRNVASIWYRMTYFYNFGEFCVQKSIFGQKQDFAMSEQQNRFRTEPTPPSKNSGRNVPTLNRSCFVFGFGNTLCAPLPFALFNLTS